jgi:hypothetical protein
MSHRSGDDGFAIGMSTIGHVIEESGMTTIAGGLDQTKNHAGAASRFGTANGRIGQLPDRVFSEIHSLLS